MKSNDLRRTLCGRKSELDQLHRYALASEKIVVSGPRRIGKTTLVREVASRLEDEGGVAAFCDLYGVFSISEIASRIARAIFKVTESRQGVRERARKALSGFRPILRVDEQGMGLSVAPVQHLTGLDLLREALEGLSRFVQDIGGPVLIILDEFQEVREIEEGLRIQAVMREHIQFMDAAFFFVGSRRRLLEDMFTDRKKPFYQSALHLRLGPLTGEEISPWTEELLASDGKRADKEAGEEIVALSGGSPYYLQLLCRRLLELDQNAIDVDLVRSAWMETLEMSSALFEASIAGLSPAWKKLLAALAKEPAARLFKAEYLGRHDLGAASTMQRAREALADRALIFKGGDDIWFVVDPGLRDWLRRLVV